MKKVHGLQVKNKVILTLSLLVVISYISACSQKYSTEAMALSRFINGYYSSYSFTALETYQDENGYYYIYEESYHDDEYWTGSSSGIIQYGGNEYHFIHEDDFLLPYESTVFETFQTLKNQGKGKIYSQEEIAAFLEEAEEYYLLTHSETKE